MAWRHLSFRPRNPQPQGSFRIFCRYMRAHLRQIVNTFIHVRQWPRIVFHSNNPVDNETGAFSSVSCRTRREREGIVDIGGEIVMKLFRNLFYWQRCQLYVG